MKNTLHPFLTVWLLFVPGTIAFTAEPIFLTIKIDGPVHDPANHSYWYGPFSEAASVLDVDGDGDLDIAAGRNWYEAPDWVKHGNFRDGAEINGPETDNNSEFAMDVNFDGRDDIVSTGWMRMKGAFWYENPGKTGVKWPGVKIHSALSLEGIIHGDIDGDGDEDILVNHWSLEPGQGITWLEHIDKEPWFIEHILGTEGEMHGNGLGDIDGDGRLDVVTPLGWWQSPAKAASQKWTFHSDYKFETQGGWAAASHPMLVSDVNGDGLNDIIVGAAHSYGLAWLEQKVDDKGKRSFSQHWIETDFGQFHTMEMGDLNGDGKADLVTGKRLFAHHGRDPSAYDPSFMFWYDIKDGRFDRHILSFNHFPKLEDDLSHRNPAPNFVPSTGLKINIADMDGDGRQDVILCGKGGLYIYYYQGSAPLPRPKHRLSPEDDYPSWIQWREKKK